MNCYYHPDTVAVATCEDCNKGLCAACASRYNYPICKSCNHRRITAEKQNIVKELLITLAAGAAITFYYLNMLSSAALPQNVGTSSKTLMLIIMFYLGCSLVAGWRALSAITPNIFLFLPLIGWLIYFFLKLMLAAMIGPFVLPFRWFNKIRRWLELNKIKAIA